MMIPPSLWSDPIHLNAKSKTCFCLLMISLPRSFGIYLGILSKRGKESSSLSSSSSTARTASRLVIVDDTANLAGKNKADSGSCCWYLTRMLQCNYIRLSPLPYSSQLFLTLSSSSFLSSIFILFPFLFWPVPFFLFLSTLILPSHVTYSFTHLSPLPLPSSMPLHFPHPYLRREHYYWKCLRNSRLL